MSEENIFDNVQSITYHFSKDGLLKDWREEALRHRKQLSEALELINQLEDRYKDKRIYVSKRYLSKIKKVLGSDKEPWKSLNGKELLEILDREEK